MAMADYRLCDKCGRKAFYDATLDYDFRTYPDTGLRNLGDWTVLCRECAAQFKCLIVKRTVDLHEVERLLQRGEIFQALAIIQRVTGAKESAEGRSGDDDRR